MKKQFTEEDIYQIEDDFLKLAHKQYHDSRRMFFRLLVTVLLILFVGALIGLILAK